MSKQTGQARQITASITLDELKRMQAEVADIPVPDAINELADDILCQLRRDDITVSDRKYLNYYPIAQAKQDQYIYLSPSHYKLRLKTTLGITAKAFFERSKHSDLDNFLMETDLSLGEVVEIDDELRPYYFYYLKWSVFVLVSSFDRSRVQK